MRNNKHPETPMYFYVAKLLRQGAIDPVRIENIKKRGGGDQASKLRGLAKAPAS